MFIGVSEWRQNALEFIARLRGEDRCSKWRKSCIRIESPTLAIQPLDRWMNRRNCIRIRVHCVRFEDTIKLSIDFGIGTASTPQSFLLGSRVSIVRSHLHSKWATTSSLSSEIAHLFRFHWFFSLDAGVCVYRAHLLCVDEWTQPHTSSASNWVICRSACEWREYRYCTFYFACLLRTHTPTARWVGQCKQRAWITSQIRAENSWALSARVKRPRRTKKM